MSGTSCRKTQQSAGRRYKRATDPFYGAAVDIARESTKAIKRREARRPILYDINVRYSSGSTYVARVVGQNVTASNTADPFEAALLVARKFAARVGMRFIGLEVVDRMLGKYQVELARVS